MLHKTKLKYHIIIILTLTSLLKFLINDDVFTFNVLSVNSRVILFVKVVFTDVGVRNQNKIK